MISQLKKKIKQAVFNKFRNDFRKEYTYKISHDYAKRLEGKPVLITGATGGIGFALCLRMALEGAIVGVGGRSEKKIADLIARLKEVCPEARLVPVVINVLDSDQIKQSIDAFAASCGNRLYVLINNAGGGERSRQANLWDQSIDLMKEIIDTNLLGSMICAKYALPYMLEKKEGRIINLSSVMGLNGKDRWCAYSSSKSGIIGLTKSLALECGPHNITVNCVSPGMVLKDKFDRVEGARDTDTTAMGRWGFTDEISSVMAFILSEEASFITGQNLVVDGGRSTGLK